MAFKVMGLTETAKGLSDLKKATQRSVLTRALKAGARPVEVRAKALARKRTGQLEQSVGTTIVRRNAGKSAYAEAMRAGASRQEAGAAAHAANKADAGRSMTVTARVGTTLWRAKFIEDGTVKMAASPFLAPALREEAGAAIDRMKTELAREIAKAAKRAARRKQKAGK